MIILKDLMSKEVVKDLIHLKEVLRIIQWIILIQVQDVIEVVRIQIHFKDIIISVKEVVLGHLKGVDPMIIKDLMSKEVVKNLELIW